MARARTVSQEFRAARTLDSLTSILPDTPWIPLKGAALRAAGYSLEGARPAVDVDVLVPAEEVAAIRTRLLHGGFLDSRAPGYEHHPGPVVAPDGVALELHRAIPGVRVRGRRFATLADLRSTGELCDPPAGGSAPGALPGSLPSRSLLVAHALAHALAQHAFTPRQTGLLWVGDLLDLEAHRPERRTEVARALEWIARDVPRSEAEAALEVARTLASGEVGRLLAEPTPARLLLEHFVAGAARADYQESLRLHSFDRPVSEAPAWLARTALVARTLVPRRGPAPGGGLEGRVEYLWRLARRPAYLWRRWRTARRARESREETLL